MSNKTELPLLPDTMLKAKDYAENLVETAHIMIIELGLDGTINIFNEGAQLIAGYCQSDLSVRIYLPRSSHQANTTM